MQKFYKGLSKEDQKKYKRLYEEFSELEDIDEMKKYIPHLILLRERGKLELSKRRNLNN